MRKKFILLTIFFLVFIGNVGGLNIPQCWAEEKEDLQKDVAFYQERAARLQAEFELNRLKWQAAEARLNQIKEKEAEKSSDKKGDKDN